MASKKPRLIGDGVRKKFFLFIIFLLASAVISYAQVKWFKASYFQNWGGLNDNTSTTEINDNEATDIQNVVFDTGGTIKKRYGYRTIPNNPIQQVATGATGITGLSFLKQNDGSKNIVAITNVAGQATAVKKTYSGNSITSGSWTNISYAGLPASYSNNQLVSFTVGENKLIFAIPSTTPTKPFLWTGSGNVSDLTADTDCPTSSIVVYHKNILFAAGNTTYPSRLFFSDLTNGITAWVATDFIDVNNNDGTKIRGLISAFDSLYILKDTSIWRLSGSDRDSFVLEKMVDKIGTLSQQSIQVVNGLIYFVTAQNDVAAYDGNYGVKFISQKIRGTLTSLNFSRAQYAIGLAFSSYRFSDFDYYAGVSYSGSGTNNRVLFFDTSQNAWSKFVGINPNSWTVAEDNNGQYIMVFGDYDGYVHYYPSLGFFDGDVATSAISSFYQTKWFKYETVALGDKYARKIKTYALSEVTPSILYFDFRSDYESTGRIFTMDLQQSGSRWDSAIWDVSTWSGSSLKVQTNEVNKGKNMFQIKYYNDTVNQGFTLFGFENFIEPSDRI